MTDQTAESPARDQIAAVIRNFPFDDYGLDDVSYALADAPDTQEWVPALATAVLDAVLPVTRITAGLARDSDATVQRVIDNITWEPPGESICEFWNDRDRILVTNRKLPAVAYLDDRAVRFTDWDQALTDLARSKAG